LNQLLWYFSDLEKQKCFVLPGGLPDWNKNADACAKWRRFAKYCHLFCEFFFISSGIDSFFLLTQFVRVIAIPFLGQFRFGRLGQF
jgi:hypothetical protein